MKNFKFKILNFKTKNAGLTLVEILVVASLTIFITISLLKNFTTSRLNLERVANVMASDIRLAQQLALSSHQMKGPADPALRNRCGYGIAVDPNSPVPQRTYIVYAGLPTVKADGVTPNNCSGARQYQTSQDIIAYKTVTLDIRVDFRDNSGQGQLFRDIYFEPPGPAVYFQQNLQNIDQSQQITIKKLGVGLQGGPPGTSCSNGNPDCIFICVYGSGRVEVVKTYNVCP